MKSPITIAKLTRLLVALKVDIGDDYRCTTCDEDDQPGMLVTIGYDREGWSYQTGDNSFVGGAYHYPVWELIYLYRWSNCRELAREAVANIQGELMDVS